MVRILVKAGLGQGADDSDSRFLGRGKCPTSDFAVNTDRGTLWSARVTCNRRFQQAACTVASEPRRPATG